MRSSCLFWVAVAGVGCGEVSTKRPDASVTPLDDATVEVDAPPAACGDGRRDPGEVCFGQPIVLVGNDVTYDAHFSDVDGDGDLDLLYLIGDQYKYFPQQAGQFAGTALNGPTTFSIYARSVNIGGSARVELVDAGDLGVATWRVNAAGTDYEAINTAAAPANTVLRAFGIGHIMGTALPNPVGIYNTSIMVGTYNTSNLTLSLTDEGGVQGTVKSLDIGHSDADTLEDIVVAGTNGVVVYRGMSGGLHQGTQTPHTTNADAVVMADVDGDDIRDLAFAVAGTAGQLGVLKGIGGTAYLAATNKSVANLGDVLENADIDGDGKQDVVAARAQTGANAVLVLLGQSDGTLADPVPLPVSAAIDYLRCDGDFNGDGAPDCVTTEINSQNMVILPSNP